MGFKPQVWVWSLKIIPGAQCSNVQKLWPFGKAAFDISGCVCLFFQLQGTTCYMNTCPSLLCQPLLTAGFRSLPCWLQLHPLLPPPPGKRQCLPASVYCLIWFSGPQRGLEKDPGLSKGIASAARGWEIFISWILTGPVEIIHVGKWVCSKETTRSNWRGPTKVSRCHKF